MKIKSIIKNCTTHGMMILITAADGTQWLGDDCSIYPLLGLPHFEFDELCNAYDIGDKKQEKICFSEKNETGTDLNLNDTDGTESICEPIGVNFFYAGQVMVPYQTQYGIMYLNRRYLEPLWDTPDDLEIYTRETESGDKYFAAKIGMILRGIITPIEIRDKKFAERLGALYRHAEYCARNVGGDENDN